MEGPPLGPGGEDITWPDQVAPRGRKASSTRKIKPQTSNLARNAAHIWGLELAYCGDSNVKDLRRVWKKNLSVCSFFQYCLCSNLRPLERTLSFERTCFSNKILIALCTLLGPAADHNYAIRRREGRTLCGKCYAGRRFTVFEEVFGTY